MTAQSSSENSVSEADRHAQKRGKRTLLLILGVSVLPIALAYFAFFTGIGVPDNTVNSGMLLPKPASVETLVPQEFWQQVDSEKKWRLMVPIGPKCNARCQENLYTTRQVHIRLGEKSDRVARFAVVYGGVEGEAFMQSIQAEHPLLSRVNVEPKAWTDWRASLGDIPSDPSNHYYYLIDQQGVAMMVYADQPGNDLLKDIKRALKYSIDYQ